MNRDKAQLSTADLARAGKDETARGDLEEIDFRGQSDEQITARDTVIDRPATPATQQNIEPGRAQESSSPSGSTPPAKTASADVHGERTPLFAEKDAADLRKRWSDIQTGFVDEPRRAVEQADSLVAEAMKRLADGFASERGTLEKQWDRGDNVTTEDLRVALQRYRSFFDRLLRA